MFGAGDRLFQRFFQPLEPAGDDFHIGQEQILVERSEVGLGIGIAEGRDDEHDAARLAERAELGGVAFVLAVQARRIDDFDGRLGDFFRIVDFAELGDARIGNGRHRALAGRATGPDRAPRPSASETACSCRSLDSR